MKKVLFTLSFLIVALVVFCVSASAVSYGGIRGDADNNGTINVKDATLVQKCIASLEEFDNFFGKDRADSDSNGIVNIKDTTIIQKFVAGIEISGVAPEFNEGIFIDNENIDDIIGVTTSKIPETSFPILNTSAPEPENPTTTTTEPEREKMDTNITIYFSNNQKWTKVNAYLYNEAEGTQNAQWPGEAMELHSTNDFGEKIYMLDVDVSEFNRVVFNNGTSQTMNASLSVASSGFYIAKNTPKNAMPLGVYAFNESNYGKIDKISLAYPDGYKKPIQIWTPNGYDPADTDTKYPVIYLLDGQNQFLGTTNGYGGWVTDKIATCLQSNGHKGFILVGIDNSRNRDKELTPDIGDVIPAYKNGFENGVGETFSNFVANDVMTYVQENYNVSLNPEDNAIIGSSSGGIEAFYIGMENMDKFGNIGSISPAFMLFDKSDWDNYLAKFDFTDADKLPRIYFFNGGADSLERELKPYAEAMPKWMAALGYPEEKMTFVFEDTFSHNEYAWRMIMPELIAWLFEL